MFDEEAATDGEVLRRYRSAMPVSARTVAAELALRSYFEASNGNEDDDATPPPDSQSVRNWLASVDPENATRPKPQDTVQGLRRYLPRRG